MFARSGGFPWKPSSSRILHKSNRGGKYLPRVTPGYNRTAYTPQPSRFGRTGYIPQPTRGIGWPQNIWKPPGYGQLPFSPRRYAGTKSGSKPDDWETRFKSWSDIGKGYEKTGDSSFLSLLRPTKALPPEEIQFCLEQGITFVKMLGFGTFATVWLVSRTDKLTGETKQLACKILNLKSFGPPKKGMFSRVAPQTPLLPEAVKLMLSEADIHQTLDHRNIVKCEHVLHMSDMETGFPHIRLLILMELCHGDLFKMIQAKRLTESQALDMFRDVADGLQYLHHNNVCHFDIKSQNVMYVKEGQNQLCYKWVDFGFSKRLSPDYGTMTMRAGTFQYMAPEMAAGQVRLDDFKAMRTDIYSLGCVLAESLLGQFWIEFIKALQNPKDRTDAEIYHAYHVPPLCGQLISRMTNKDPDKRPAIDEVLQDPWLQNKH